MAEPKTHTTSEQAKALQELDSSVAEAAAPTETISVEEMSVRASHSAEGGGAWPPHLLKQFIDPVQPGFQLDVEVPEAKPASKASSSNK